MKNKVLIGSLAATLVAFILYSANLRRINNASIKVITPSSSKIIKNKKAQKRQEPQLGTVEYSNHIKIAKGSNRELAGAIKSAMGLDDSYQVAVQDLRSDKFARVANTTKTHQVTGTAKLFLLAAIYYQEQTGRFNPHTVIKITKADRVKGEKFLQKGMMYGVTYLRQAMMRGNRTAANAFVRKIGPKKITAFLHKLGATDTTVFVRSKQLRATTTAVDLNKVMVGLYHGKVLNRQYSDLALSLIRSTKFKIQLTKNLPANVCALGDGNSAVALVQSARRVYCVAVWCEHDNNFKNLGSSVNKML
ncbi:serine hydrolase [Lactobacillus sp. ESL0791]|uniref:serine hydrolase n=1 Tax=Lactobacillus sp. ESL0791 TaxID=2983234 RepID=UPI0023F8DB98|nr:serine hydrolase [Lactobacillus sp. ESL0791]MDF7638224.1 serine hydrolase [Lactobacillus sp. ESL0791]